MSYQRGFVKAASSSDWDRDARSSNLLGKEYEFKEEDVINIIKILVT